jgi:ATP adenylyltransferase
MPDLDRLWAPWRNQYLSRQGPKGCFFCAAHRSRMDRKHQVIARGRWAFAMLNRYPYNNGHVMVAPYRHVARLERITAAEWLDFLALSQTLTRRLQQALRPHGFNLGLNIGRSAGAGVPGHLHMHLVPRWNGDTNFFPILAHTKVISQSLDELYDILAPAPRRSRR